jgi:hypothetical protein
MSATKCTDCTYEAVRTLNGKPYCLKCFEEAKVLLMPRVRDGGPHDRTVRIKTRVGNPHPSTPLSELRYNGTLAWAG